MRKYQWLIIWTLIVGMAFFASCERAQDMLDPVISEPKPPEVIEDDALDTTALQNRLTIEGATAVGRQLPATSTAETAPRIQADVEEINASPGGTVSLPFAYSGTNALAGCIVCIEGVDGYFDLPYTGAPDALPTAISVGLPQNVALGSFTVCYSVYDDQGQYGNFINVVINVTEPEVVEPEPPEVVEPEPPVVIEPEPPMGPADVLIYTYRSFWMKLDAAKIAAETTKSLLESKGIQVEITENNGYLRDWMLQTTGDGSVNVLIIYGVLPSTIYAAGNPQTDGSIAENWIETTDGDTILNHADYIAFNSELDVDDEDLIFGHSNDEWGLRNLMDNPNIRLFIQGNPEKSSLMVVTPDGSTLTPSLVDFESYRPIPLNQLQGEWYAEKVFASDTGDTQATYADPVIVRDGNRGRLAIVHATHLHTRYEDLVNGEIAAEIIINYLLAE